VTQALLRLVTFVPLKLTIISNISKFVIGAVVPTALRGREVAGRGAIGCSPTVPSPALRRRQNSPGLREGMAIRLKAAAQLLAQLRTTQQLMRGGAHYQRTDI